MSDDRRDHGDAAREEPDVDAFGGEDGPALDRVLRAELQSLPLEAQPARDLWPGIEARMRSGGGEAPDPRSRDGHAASRRGDGRFVTWGQFAAAAVLVTVLSGSLVWMATSRTVPGPVSGGSPEGEAVSGAMEVQMAVAEEAFGTYEGAVSELRRIVEESSGGLAPETVRALEENLATVEQALADARDALLADPSADGIGPLLSGTMRRRLNVLRDAVTAAVSQS